MGESIEEGGVGGSGDGGVDDSEGYRTIVIDKNMKLTGRLELASLKTEAARSGYRIRIISRSGWGAGMLLGA